MTVIMVLEMDGDVEGLKRVASEHGDKLREIAQQGKAAGAVHHGFYVSDDGRGMVVDEWDNPENFKRFFEEQGPNIGPLMQEAGMQPKEPKFYEKLDTGDSF